MTMSQTQIWVPVALSADVPAGSVIPAKIPTGTIALWRSQSGQINASNDRCPHRGMRLSQGFVRGEKLQCIYHGWSFAADGQCTSIPAHPNLTPPKAITCGKKSVIEQSGIVWVSEQMPDHQPPLIEGFKALKSLHFTTNLSAIEKTVGAVHSDGFLSLTMDGMDIKLLLAETDSPGTLVHLLVAEATSIEACIKASRFVEVIRMKAEELD